MTIEQAYTHFIQRLKEIYELREASNIADWVFESTAGIKRLDRIIDKNRQLENLVTDQLNLQLQQLIAHKPVQYVLEEAWFYKKIFFVNEHVLIPRPETEELVEWIVEEAKLKTEKINIIDIGTGSGCIAIALKEEFPKADIVAADVSEQALIIAAKNALSLNKKINTLKLDFLDESQWTKLTHFDIMVSNPPYIPEKEKNLMQKNVVDYEPYSALFVSDDDPFIFYKKIARFALSHLKPAGKIYVEVHEKYANEVAEIFLQNTFKSRIKEDIHGRERMICLQR